MTVSSGPPSPASSNLIKRVSNNHERCDENTGKTRKRWQLQISLRNQQKYAATEATAQEINSRRRCDTPCIVSKRVKRKKQCLQEAPQYRSTAQATSDKPNAAQYAASSERTHLSTCCGACEQRSSVANSVTCTRKLASFVSLQTTIRQSKQ